MNKKNRSRALLLGVVMMLALAYPRMAAAHCDTMDGPVVVAARQALESGDINPALIWVQPSGEAEIRNAFEQVLSVRKLGDSAKELADRYFFETIVRVHRAGEGEPYTGLKPSGTDLGKAIPAADRALETASLAEVKSLVNEAVTHGMEERFQKALNAKKFNKEDVPAGREYVKAYVSFIHYLEGVYDATAGASHGHGEEKE